MVFLVTIMAEQLLSSQSDLCFNYSKCVCPDLSFWKCSRFNIFLTHRPFGHRLASQKNVLFYKSVVSAIRLNLRGRSETTPDIEKQHKG